MFSNGPIHSFYGDIPIQDERRMGQSFLVRCANIEAGESRDVPNVLLYDSERIFDPFRIRIYSRICFEFVSNIEYSGPPNDTNISNVSNI